MQKFKKILPILVVLVLSIIVCILFSKQYAYSNYEKDLDNYNTKISSLKSDINAYNKVLSSDGVSTDLNYIKEDGATVINMQKHIISEYEKYGSTDLSKRNVKYEKTLHSMIDNRDSDKANTFCYPWSESEKYNIVFLSDFYNGKSKVKVSWEIFEKNKLKFIVKAEYDVISRKYSDLTFDYVDYGEIEEGDTGVIISEDDDDNYVFEDPDDFSDWDDNDTIGDKKYDDLEVD